MNKQFLFKACIKIITLSLLTACTATSYIEDKNAALIAKELSYINNSQVNTSFTLTMGEREFILAERDVKKGDNKSAVQHFRKAKDFYNEAYISSYIFQRNWTLENYIRILELKEKRLLISEILTKVYRYISEISVNKKSEAENIQAKFDKIKNIEIGTNKILENADITLGKALKLSIEYDMFQTKYATLDAIKETDKAIDIIKKTINELFPELLSEINFDKKS